MRFFFTSLLMRYYHSPQELSARKGNNLLSYQERVSLLWKAQIYIPSINRISSLEEISLSWELRIQEINEHGHLENWHGLAHIYEFTHNNTFISLFDNHNHAFRYWSTFMIGKDAHQHQILHIDQHSDFNPPLVPIDAQQREHRDYLNTYWVEGCQISSFIRPFLELYPECDYLRIRSEHQLLEFPLKIHKKLILDIDLDFWAPSMSPEFLDKSLSKTRQLIEIADLVTIASSPLFLEQEYALQLLSSLFPAGIWKSV